MSKTQIVVAALFVLTVVGAILTGVFMSHKSDSEVRAALDSCLYDIENNCKGLFEYAAALEKENSSLNVAIKECRQKDTK